MEVPLLKTVGSETLNAYNKIQWQYQARGNTLMVTRHTDTSASNLDSCKYLVVMSYVRICIVIVVG